MCIVYSRDCVCFRDEREHHEEAERVAAASAVEHDVLDALLDADAAPVSPRTARLAEAIRRHPLVTRGGVIVDLLVTDAGAYFWIMGDGRQHHARLDGVRSIRLAA